MNSNLDSDQGRFSIEPCHPLGFWSQRQEQYVQQFAFGHGRHASQYLETNALELINKSIGKAVASLINYVPSFGDDFVICFLLDDLFVSNRLMDMLPVERIAEMISQSWKRSAKEANRIGQLYLPHESTIVSERSLIQGALAMIGQRPTGDDTERNFAFDYQGVGITVPKHARTYSGDIVPSCPLLAAAWQLWRLGRLRECNDLVQWWGEDQKPADGTFTMLCTSLIHVEAAVAAILDTLETSHEDRDVIAYMFKPDHW